MYKFDITPFARIWNVQIVWVKIKIIDCKNILTIWIFVLVWRQGEREGEGEVGEKVEEGKKEKKAGLNCEE